MTHQRLSPRFSILLAAASLALVALLAGACKGDAAPPARYTARGIIEALPTAESRNAILIQHEAMPTFVHRDGKGRGMEAMTMPFGVAPDLDLAGIAKGDKIEFTIEVSWERHPAASVVSVRKLPADTALEL